jgi:hypothetical protein
MKLNARQPGGDGSEATAVNEAIVTTAYSIGGHNLLLRARGGGSSAAAEETLLSWQ